MKLLRPLSLLLFAGAGAVTVLIASPARAQAERPEPLPTSKMDDDLASAPGLAQYERDALAGNLALGEKQLEIERRAAERKVATAGYLPTVDLSARYTHFLHGGLDLGDLINPAYAALNQLSGEQRFPTDIELRLPLALEAKLELRQPIYVPALGVASRLAALGHKASQVELEIAQREVIAGVRAAYLGHTRAAQVGALLQSTRALLEENLRVSKQLVSADKQTGDVVFRAQAELAAHEQLIRQVADAQRAAARALNQLRGKPLDESVESLPDLDVPDLMPFLVGPLVATAKASRTELRLLGVGKNVAQAERDLIDTGRLPTVAVAADYGLQSSDFSVGTEDDFATVSVVAAWNLFDGRRDSRRRKVKDLELAATEVRRQQLLQQIELEVRNAHGAAEVALGAVAAAKERVTSAQAAFDIVNKKYAAGAVQQIELIAARTSLLQARTDQITAATDYHLRLVELERVTESKGRLP
jgi:outer membrane protein TolC